jgi:chemotaxis response regulator CheB
MLRTPQTTVLVVDDSKDWRLQIRQILQARPQWKIVAEAGDGAEAVRKATDLQPDITSAITQNRPMKIASKPANERPGR